MEDIWAVDSNGFIFQVRNEYAPLMAEKRPDLIFFYAELVMA